ncbi:MAG: DUF4097 family beta strand repeat-containing protein [Gemmatimonadaceae bacterium]
MNRSVSIGICVAIFASTLPAQDETRKSTDSTFNWSGTMAPGSTLRIHDVTGSIDVIPAGGGTAEVHGERRSNWRGKSDDITFQVIKDGNDVVVCAFYTDNGRCDAHGIRSEHDGWRDHHASARLSVKLPNGVHLHAASGNGDVSVRDAGADVEVASGNGRVTVGGAKGEVRASSGNGDITIDRVTGRVSARTGNGQVRVSTTSGPVSAASGNGSIDVRMDGIQGSDDMDFRTGNGRITVELPASFSGEIDARQGSGHFDSDFPLTLQGRMSGGHVRGTIGKGGRYLRMSSGSGNIALKKID